MGLLQTQVIALQSEIDSAESDMALLKEIVDNDTKALREKVSLLKRVLRTTTSAIEAMDGADVTEV